MPTNVDGRLSPPRPRLLNQRGKDRKYSPQLSSSQPLSILKSQKKDNEDEQQAASTKAVENVVWYLVAALSLLTLAATIWSEVSVYQTGCGPLFMPDVVERVSYQAVIVLSGVAWFIRIVFRQGLADFVVPRQGIVGTGDKDKSIRILLSLMEGAAYVAVAGAFLVLFHQIENNVQMDGLSGIDIAACKSRRDFLLWQS